MTQILANCESLQEYDLQSTFLVIEFNVGNNFIAKDCSKDFRTMTRELVNIIT